MAEEGKFGEFLNEKMEFPTPRTYDLNPIESMQVKISN